MPVFAAKAGGFFFIIFGVIVLIGALVQINPIWVYGPYDPSPVSAGTQPDWYIGFADGVLRLIPPGWELELFGFTLSLNILVPVCRSCGLFLVLVAIYPFFEQWVTGDKREHHIADRPRNALDAHRDRRGRRHLLRRASGLLRAPTSSPTHLPLSASSGSRTALQALALRGAGRRLLRRAPHLHRAPEEGSRDRAARLRVGPHRAPAWWRVHRGAPAAQQVRALGHW